MYQNVPCSRGQNRSFQCATTEKIAKAVAEARAALAAAGVPVPVRNERPYRRALVVSLLNPKAILFFAAFFVQFVHPDDPHLWSNFGVLAVIMQCISAAYLATGAPTPHGAGTRTDAATTTGELR